VAADGPAMGIIVQSRHAWGEAATLAGGTHEVFLLSIFVLPNTGIDFNILKYIISIGI
jgi:hypothetical protein